MILGPAPFLPPSKVTQLSPLWPSIPLEGKKQVWQYGVIPILVHLLKDHVEEVQANAAGALMYAMVTTTGEAACWPGTEVGRASPCVGTGTNCAGGGSPQPPSMLVAPASFPELLTLHSVSGYCPSLPCPGILGLLLKSFQVWVPGSPALLVTVATACSPRCHLVTCIRTSVPSLQANSWAWNFCL